MYEYEIWWNMKLKEPKENFTFLQYIVLLLDSYSDYKDLPK